MSNYFPVAQPTDDISGPVPHGMTQEGFVVDQYGGDSVLNVEFYPREKTGDLRDNPDKEIYCKIQMPGNPYTIHDQPVRESDKLRFREKWEKFLAGKQVGISGIPLADWGRVARSPNQIDHLKQHGIHTVEQMAGVLDINLNHLGLGAYELRKAAREFLASAGRPMNTEQVIELKQDNADMRSELDKLRQQISGLSSLKHEDEESEETIRRRPGRPRKEVKDES